MTGEGGADVRIPGAEPGSTAARDVLIVGGGVIGSSVAYFLSTGTTLRASGPGTRRGRENPKVTVVEPDPTYARSSTALSVGGIRLQFSTPENILLSRFTSDFLRRAPELLAVGGDCPDLGYVEAGYLFLATSEGIATLHRNHRMQRGLGADVAMLSLDELRERFPWLNTGDLAAGSLGLGREGWIDPHSLLQALRRKAVEQGVEYVRDRVTGMEKAAGRILSVTLERGGRVPVGAVVDAAGPRAGEVALMAGIRDLPVHPRKRFVYRIRCPRTLPNCPLVVDPSGVYFRPEGNGFLCGVSPPPDRDPDTLDLEVDHDLFHEVIWPVLAHRVPAFDALRLESSWAGHYAVNTVDHNAIIGPHPQVENFFFANGFSGHGLQHSPGVGRAVAELVLHGRYLTLDLSRLRFERLSRGEPILEDNVV